jgi:hypothetical protein
MASIYAAISNMHEALYGLFSRVHMHVFILVMPILRHSHTESIPILSMTGKVVFACDSMDRP